jgi:predicted nucleic acid-binding protein
LQDDHEAHINSLKASHKGTAERHKVTTQKLEREREKTKQLEKDLRAARAAEADAKAAQAAAEAREAATKQELTALRKSVNDMMTANIAAMATALQTTLYGVAPAPPNAADAAADA